MSGLENITQKLLADAQAQCRDILTAARESADKAVADAEKTAEEMMTAARKESEKQSEKIIERAKAAVESNERRILLEEKIRLIDKTLDTACRNIRNLSDGDYFKVLFSFAARARLNGVGVMYLSKKDLARVPKDFAIKLGADIRIADTPMDIEDGFILKYGDIEMNCTLKAMFNAYREELKAKAAEKLF